MSVAIERSGVRVTVELSGCMTTFEADVDGRPVSPLYEAPWSRDEAEGLLSRLRGDFVCVPFGNAPASLDGFAGRWRDVAIGRSDWPHGYSSNAVWEVEREDAGSAEFVVRYPEGYVVDRVRRRVECIDGGVEITDTIAARQSASLPIGLHPMLRLPTEPGAGRLRLPRCSFVATLPHPTDESSILAQDAFFDDPALAPLADGGSVDLTSVPLDAATEEVVLLCNVEAPRVEFDNLDEGYRVVLEWDPEPLEHLQLWFSNRGRAFAPWNGQNLCLGVEPVTAAFDLGAIMSASPNPLNDAGAPTAVDLREGAPLTFAHRITVAPLPSESAR